MIPEAFFVQADANLGAVEIATFLGLVLYGISLAQGYAYFRRSESDSRTFKVLVGVLLLMESFHSFTASHTIYYDTVSRYKDAEINSYQLSANAATETLLTVVVQCFFCHRIYRISKKKKPISILCFSLALLRLVLGLAMSAECVIDVHRTPNWVVFVTEFNWLITSTLAVGAAADVAIACAMLYYLRKLAAPGNMKSTAAILNRLVRWSLQTGLITSMTSVTVIICFQAMSNLVWFGLYVVLAKVYTNSLLASLNARPRKRRSSPGRRQAVSTNMIFDTIPGQGAEPIGLSFQLTELSSGTGTGTRTTSTGPSSMPTTSRSEATKEEKKHEQSRVEEDLDEPPIGIMPLDKS